MKHLSQMLPKQSIGGVTININIDSIRYLDNVTTIQHYVATEVNLLVWFYSFVSYNIGDSHYDDLLHQDVEYLKSMVKYYYNVTSNPNVAFDKDFAVEGSVPELDSVFYSKTPNFFTLAFLSLDNMLDTYTEITLATRSHFHSEFLCRFNQKVNEYGSATKYHNIFS